MQSFPRGGYSIIAALAFLWGGVGAGCQPEDDAEEGAQNALFKAGDRLRPIVFDGGFDSARLKHFFDTELGTECIFRASSDDSATHYCTPTLGAELYFEDADCKKPVISSSGSCVSFGEGAFVYADDRSADTCLPYVRRYYRVGQSVEPSTVYQKGFVSGDCEPAAQVDLSTLHSVTEVRSDTFVSATVQTQALSDGLERRELIGADGSRQTLGLAVEGRTCSAHAIGGELRCVPEPVVFLTGNVSASESCEGQEVYSWLEGQCGDDDIQAVLRRDANNACLVIEGVFAPGSPVTGAIYGEEGAECVERPQQDGLRYAVLGEELSATSFPALRRVPVGEGEARPLYYATADGELLMPTDEWTNAEGEPCTVAQFTDGVTRCLPRARAVSLWTGHFLNAECTVPAYTEAKATASCVPGRPLAVDFAQGCAVLSVYSLLPFEGQGYMVNPETEECEPFDPAELGIDLYEQGPVLDPATLPVIAEVR